MVEMLSSARLLAPVWWGAVMLGLTLICLILPGKRADRAVDAGGHLAMAFMWFAMAGATPGEPAAASPAVHLHTGGLVLAWPALIAAGVVAIAATDRLLRGQGARPSGAGRAMMTAAFAWGMFAMALHAVAAGG